MMQRGRNCRKCTFGCQSLLLKQIGNRRLAYFAKHLLRTERTVILRAEGIVLLLWLRTRNNSLTSIWILIWINVPRKSIFALCCPRAAPVALAPLIVTTLAALKYCAAHRNLVCARTKEHIINWHDLFSRSYHYKSVTHSTTHSTSLWFKLVFPWLVFDRHFRSKTCGGKPA